MARTPSSALLPAAPSDPGLARAGPPTVQLDAKPSAPGGPIAAVLAPALAACDSAISFRVREGTRAPGGGLLTALIDAVELGQTTLDLAHRGSPLLPKALGLCAEAFQRAEEACLARGDEPLRACARILAEARPKLLGSA